MHLIVVSKHYGHISGASVATCEFVKRWAAKVDRISIVCATAWYREDDVPKAPNIVVNALSPFDPVSIFRACRTIATPYSILYSPDDYGIFGKLTGLPYVMTNHSNWPYAMRAGIRYFLVGLIHTPLYALNFWLADAVVSYSRFGQLWVKHFNPKSLMIRNGISVRKNGTQLVLKHPNLMTVGRMDSRKGMLLVKLVNELRIMGVEFYLYIVGQVVHPDLKQMIDNKGLISVGFKPNTGDYLNECDVFVLTSRMENLSLAVTEALYEGKPVVCFDVGGLGEIVTEETGALIKRFDVGEMAQAIAYLLDNEEERRARGQRAKMITQEFDWDRSAELYLDLFREFLQRG